MIRRRAQRDETQRPNRLFVKAIKISINFFDCAIEDYKFVVGSFGFSVWIRSFDAARYIRRRGSDPSVHSFWPRGGRRMNHPPPVFESHLKHLSENGYKIIPPEGSREDVFQQRGLRAVHAAWPGGETPHLVYTNRASLLKNTNAT